MQFLNKKGEKLKIKFKKIQPNIKDLLLITAVICLAVFGVIMVYSASNYNAELNYNNKYFYMTKQIIGVVLGTLAMTFFYFFDYHKLDKWKHWILLASFILLIIVFIPGLGSSTNGATRWIRLPGFTIQPSEIAKFGFVIFVSGYLSKNYDIIKKFSGIFPVLVVGGLMCFLIMLEPNMSITMCVGITMLVMLFVGGARFKHFALMSVPIALLVPALIIVEPYRFKRLVAFINPWENPKGEGYQLLQSLYSIGEGGLFGVGLFNSRQKYLFLPFSESDFIFSIICEELGLLGAVITMLLFLLVIISGIRIAKFAKDRLG
ncbi:MAG TPA: stage V sporulation protein E, partial [Clostridiales bacterium]|nr:stage V sporulation protein E [Clostridiales bacterium]